jgi:murein DD-endopeptidase MepM/ murein hydrolase activator NlpD
MPKGVKIYAAYDGIVITSMIMGGYGNYIVIKHPDGYRTAYAHLSSRLVSATNIVKEGQLIGESGGKPGDPGAGSTTGPHLHFEVANASGTYINPHTYGGPVKK